jgi:RNA methyltransferase, TrmH family
VITSAANPRLKLVRRLHSRSQRERLGLFACEGEDLVEAALAAGLEPVDLLVAGESVAPELLAAVSTLPHASRTIGVFRRADLPVSSERPVGLALWRVSDPGNVGTLIRTADALGPAFIALSEGCADPTGQKALRASAGAVFRVPLGRFGEASGRRIALVARGGRPLPGLELQEGDVLVLGAEREGLPLALVDQCAEVATIPLAPGAESLNVAAAGAIALYEWERQCSSFSPRSASAAASAASAPAKASAPPRARRRES